MEINKKSDAFEIVKRIVGENQQILCDDYGSYIIISTSNKPYWICRIYSNNGVNTISFPIDQYKGEANVCFNKIDEISNYSNYIISAFNTAVTF